MTLGMYNKNVISKKVKHNIKTEYLLFQKLLNCNCKCKVIASFDVKLKSCNKCKFCNNVN